VSDLDVSVTFSGRDESLSQTAVLIARNVQQANQAFDQSQVAAQKFTAGQVSMAQQLAVNKAALAGNTTELKAYAAATAQAEQAQRKIDEAVKAAGGSAQKAGMGFGDAAKSMLGFATAATGVTLGAAAIHEAMAAVVSATAQANQAQLSINALYGQSAPIFKTFADQLAASTNITAAAAERGVAQMAILQKQYGLTGSELQQLSKLAVDAAAVFGGDVQESFRSFEAAIRGEPEALEKYGLALQQNAIQNSKLLTEWQQKNFNSLDAVTQARLRYQIILEKGKDIEGAAQKRAESQQGAFDKLAVSTNKLAIALGKDFEPGAAKAVSWFDQLIDRVTRLIEKNRELKEAAPFAPDVVAEGDAEVRRRIDAIARGGGAAPSAPYNSAGQDAREAFEDKRARDAQARRDQDVAKEKEASRERGQILAEELKDAADARLKDLDDQKTILQVREQAEIQSVDRVRDARLAEIHEAAEASKAASEAYIAGLRAEEDAAKRAVASEKQDRLDGIDAAKKAADADADAQVARLKREEADATKSADVKRDAEIAALDATKRAREDARTAEDRAMRDDLEHVKRAEDQRYQAVTRELDAEAKAAADTRDTEIRALDAQAKKAESVHQSRLRHFQDEDRAAQKAHDDEARRLDDELRAEQKAHDQRSRQLDDEERTLQKNHDVAVRAISDEIDAAQKAHDQKNRQLDDEAKALQAAHDITDRRIADELAAAQKAHDIEDRRLGDQLKGAQDLHDATTRRLSDELAAAKDVHDQTVRALSDEQAKAEDAHQATIRRLSDEMDAAKDAHDQRTRALADEQARADAAHRKTLDDLQAEQDARLGILDTQLKALDAQEKSAAAQDKLGSLQKQVANAQQSVTTATGSGSADQVQRAQDALQRAYRVGDRSLISNAEQTYVQLAGQGPAAIKAAQDQLVVAQKALLDEQTKQARDAQRQQLEDQKTAISQEIATKKQAADSEYDQLQSQVKADKQAADDELDRVQKQNAAEKRAADDELARIKYSVAARKQAAGDALDQVQRRTDAERRAADDELDRVRDIVAAAKTANDDQFAATRDRLAQEKQANDDALAHDLARIAAEKQANDDALVNFKDKLDLQKIQLDDALDQARERIATEKRANDEAFTAFKEVIDGKKRANDEVLAGAKEDIRQDQVAEELAYGKTKERIADRKKKVNDQYDDEIEKIGKRKLAESEAHDAIVLAYQDQSQKKKDAVADVRTAEDRADSDLRTAANTARDEEIARIKAIYTDDATGLIPATQRAKAAADESFDGQKTAVERSAAAQIQAISDIYSTPGKTGLIDLAEKAAAANQIKFNNMAADVTASAQAQKAAIKDTYESKDPANPGLLTRLDNLKTDTETALKADLEKWSNWQKGLTEGNGPIKKTWDDATKQFDDFIKHIQDPKNGGSPSGNNPSLPPRETTGAPDSVSAGPKASPAAAPSGAMSLAAAGNDGASQGAAASQAFGSRISDDQSKLLVDMFSREIAFDLPKMGGPAPGHPNQSALFQRLLAAAMPAASQFDLPAYIMAAIPIQEGIDSELQTRYHNLFSIKGTGPAGSVTMRTREIINGHEVYVNDAFRVYHNEAESYVDFGKLITQSGIYDNAVSVWHQTHDARKFAETMGKKYATDPDWGDKIADIAGYDRPDLPRHEHGGWIPDPTILVSARSLRPIGTMAETGPEYIESVTESRARANGTRSTAGGGIDYDRLARAITDNLPPTVIVHGVGLNEVADETVRRQRIATHLRSARKS
jgi:hypothetical protein